MTNWKEGARQGRPEDRCPTCGLERVLVWDFKKFGKHTLVVCPTCLTIFVDGQKSAAIEVSEA